MKKNALRNNNDDGDDDNGMMECLLNYVATYPMSIHWSCENQRHFQNPRFLFGSPTTTYYSTFPLQYTA